MAQKTAHQDLLAAAGRAQNDRGNITRRIELALARQYVMPNARALRHRLMIAETVSGDCDTAHQIRCGQATVPPLPASAAGLSILVRGGIQSSMIESNRIE